METVAIGMETTEATGMETQDMEVTEIMANAPGITGAPEAAETRSRR